jgi:phosphorylase kinase alpha/beta subunit
VASEYTGYSAAWVRDNVQIAHAHFAWGETSVAARCVAALAEYFRRHRHRFENIIAGRIDSADVMQRPHIRFDGGNLSELPERWAHAQNDALGYFVWLYCRMIAAGCLAPHADDGELLATFVRYFAAIRFWQDEDSGHWEESRKINASSIGTATAGLVALRSGIDGGTALHWDDLRLAGAPVLRLEVNQLIDTGRAALRDILPSECIQPDPTKSRRHDAALLFLVDPLRIVQGSLADMIVEEVREQLLGNHGIRRYRGDSYWCADYKTLLREDERTADFSDDVTSRDRLLRPGEEAQWCLFDPQLSIHYGRRFQATGLSRWQERQILHLNRALNQLTDDSTSFPPFRCPESYALCAGRYVPNDITPLQWTQALLRLALFEMERSLSMPWSQIP